jgi:hypothetical protein
MLLTQKFDACHSGQITSLIKHFFGVRRTVVCSTRAMLPSPMDPANGLPRIAFLHA